MALTRKPTGRYREPVSPATEPKQKRARETRRRILEAAANVFARDGYDGCSLNDLIRETGVTKGAFYFHFASKLDVALATFRFKQEQVLERAQAEIGDQPDAAAELAAMVRARARIYREDPSARAVLRLGAELGTTAGSGSEFAQFQELTIEALARVVRRGQREGLFRQDLDPREAGEVILGALIGADRLSRLLTGGSDAEHRGERVVDVLVRGMAAPGRGEAQRKSHPLKRRKET
jgi:AcrR family transcriptional regulator